MKQKPILTTIFFAALLFGLTTQTSYAGSATWNSNPTGNDWNTAVNWTPATVPNGPTDLATFDTSAITRIGLSGQTLLSGLIFDPGAGVFTITVPYAIRLAIRGPGVTNSSGVARISSSLGAV